MRAELFRITGTDLTQVDGIDVVTATTILSEAGWDMSPWKDEDHFVSWLRLCPNNRISGNKVLARQSSAAQDYIRNGEAQARNQRFHLNLALPELIVAQAKSSQEPTV